jgi:altronate dehydratase small subunit
MTGRAIIINENDNVVNMIGRGRKGQEVACTIEGRREAPVITLHDDIPSNHKFARQDIAAGESVIKYGLSIGKASRDIKKGAYVHTHNVESNRGRGDRD